MKIKMTYSLELGDVPFKVKEITSDVGAQLKTLGYSSEALDPTNLNLFLEKTKKIREKLFFLDNQLNDCVEIIEGYQKTLEDYGHLDLRSSDLNLRSSNLPHEQDFDTKHHQTLSELQGNLERIDELVTDE